MERFHKTLADGVELVMTRTNQFKTGVFSVTLTVPLRADTATAYALIPDVLYRGSRNHPNMESLSAATDELYGEGDIAAVKFARDCGIDVIASSHVCDRVRLAALPFDRYAELCGVGRGSVIYDKNFDIVCDNRPDDLYRRDALRGKEEESCGIRRTV